MLDQNQGAPKAAMSIAFASQRQTTAAASTDCLETAATSHALHIDMALDVPSLV